MKLARLAPLLLVACAGCKSPWHSGEAWNFALTREVLGDGDLPNSTPRSHAVEDTLDHPSAAPSYRTTSPTNMRGGVEDLWIVGLFFVPVVVPFVLDVALLPLTAPHDLFVD